MTPETTPAGIKKIGQEKLEITWLDKKVCVYSAQKLRQECRCASCQNELTGERILIQSDVPADLKLLGAETVGNYALSFTFSDNHGSGIYPFDVLRKIGA